MSEVADLVLEVNHHDSGFGGLGALVAEGTAGAVNGVLLGVDGEDPEDYGGITVGVEGGDSLGYALAYVVEMGRSAATQPKTITAS